MKLKVPKNLIIIYFCIAIAAMGMGLVVPLIPKILQQHHATPSIIGLTTTIMAVSILTFSLPIGKLIDKYGGKPIIASGLLLYGLSMAFFPYANTLLNFIFWRIVEGAGAAAIWVGTETQINFYSDQSNRTKLLSIYAVFAGVGFGSGPLIGSLFLEADLHMAFMMAVAIIVVAFISLVLFLDKGKTNPIRQENTLNNDLTILKKIRVFLAGAVLYGWMESSMSTLLTLYLQKIDFPSLQVGITFFIFIIGGVVIPPFTGYLGDKYGRKKVMKVFAVILAISTFLMPWQKLKVLIWGLAFLTGASGISIYITSLASLGDGVNEEKLGTANAYFAISYSLGSIVGPFLAGLGFQYIDKGFLFWQISILAVAFLGIYKVWGSEKKMYTIDVH